LDRDLVALAPAAGAAPQIVEEDGRLNLEPPPKDARLGWSVAVDGDTVLAGSPFADGAAARSGTAHVFVGAGTSWAEQAVLGASDAESLDFFGHHVALTATRRSCPP